MDERLEIFKSIFKGRTDAFAIRWQKNGNSGYTPAYDLNWEQYRKHKEAGGSLKDFSAKTYATLSNDRLLKHLSGGEIIGIYPLLSNNTSWLIAADFDESVTSSWLAECRAFITECIKYNLPIYLERSRSGKGGHVWLFFQHPYPAEKSRKIFHYLLSVSSVTEKKKSSFDRLFPNQDYHTGKELGNLIALPLQKQALEKQNACFIDPATEMPFADQWEFLKSIQKVSTDVLNKIFENIISTLKPAVALGAGSENSNKLHIILDNYVKIYKQNVPNLLIRFLRDNLNFLNNTYFAKKNAGINTFGTDKYFTSLDTDGDSFGIPRGFIGKLIRYCKEQNIEYILDDKRIRHESIEFSSSALLHPHQQAAVDTTEKKDFGIIVSPPGSGKTVMGIAVIACKKQPALIIVHRKQLFDQWIERVQSFLGIPSFRIGKIEGGSFDIGHEVTVAMIQSLQSDRIPEKLFHSFGTIIIDECHHIPAKTFRNVIERFYSYYLYGFTATPIRKNNDEKLIFIQIGDIIHEVIVPANLQGNKPLSLFIQNTTFSLPFNSLTDNIETLMHILVHDTARNGLIAADIIREVKAGRKVLVLTERKQHIEILNQYLKASCQVITLTGDDSREKRNAKFSQIEAGEFQVALATGQLIGEGMDINSISCLVLAYPFSFEGKLIQYLGRVQRSQGTPVIYDYKDHLIEYLANLFKERNKFYRKLLKEGKLSKFDELLLNFKEKFFCINETEQWLNVDCLDIPFPIERFADDITWKIRVLNYDEQEGVLFTEILDYNYPIQKGHISVQGVFYFYGIEKITFRAIDTNGLMQSVVLSTHRNESTIMPLRKPTSLLQELVLVKTMKVPLWKIKFMPGVVSFPVYIEELGTELTFEIANANIRPEFEAIRDYFSKALKKKLITTELAIRYDAENIISATATSEDIDNINGGMIDTMRFQFVKKEVLQNPEKTVKQMHTLDELPASKSTRKFYITEQELIDDILAIRKSRHYLQLKYLASKHEASVLKIRFVLHPFSFIFLMAGEKKYYIIWETLDTEEASYIWSGAKTREALKKLLVQIETGLSEIENIGRQAYIAKQQEDFYRIMHDYEDARKGFIAWKSALEERMV